MPKLINNKRAFSKTEDNDACLLDATLKKTDAPSAKSARFSIDDLLLREEAVTENNFNGNEESERDNVSVLSCSDPSVPSTSDSGVQCRLESENRKLWRDFNRIDTEMIITKQGR